MASEAPKNPKLKCEKTLFTYCSSSARTSTSLPGFKIFCFKIDVISPGLLVTWKSCLEQFYVFNLVVFLCFKARAQFPLQPSRTLEAVKPQKCFVGLQTFLRHRGAEGQRRRFSVGGQKNVWWQPLMRKRRAPPLVRAVVGGFGFISLQVWGRVFAPPRKMKLAKEKLNDHSDII